MTIPKVSVCITAYNHEAYIAQAIESVLAQVVDFGIEILVGEDASTDKTRAIVAQYAEKHPTIIRAFYHSAEDKLFINGRITGRKNLANNLLQARGEYVVVLDGDDFWLDNKKLATQVKFLDENAQYSGCFHNAIHVDENGIFLDRLAVDLQQQDYFLKDMLVTNPVPTMSCLFRNQHPVAMPPWFYKTDMGDWPLHIMSAQRGVLHYMPVVMAAYRIHDSGRWKSFRDDYTLGLYSQIKTWKIMLAEAGLGEDALIKELIDKNYRRIIRKQKSLGQWAAVKKYLVERKSQYGQWDWYGIKQSFIANLHSESK